MDKYEDIEGGWLTVRRLSITIDTNIKTAAEFGIKLSWQFVGNKIRARMQKGGKIVFEKIYFGKHTHLHIAELHADFEERLQFEINSRIHEKKIRERMENEKKEESKLTMWEAAKAQKQREEQTR